MKRLDWYLLRLIVTRQLATLVIAVTLLVLDQMLRLIEFVMNEGGPISALWKMLVFLLPEYLGLALPISLFLGTLLAFQQLAVNNEIETMFASGISTRRLLYPVMALSIVMTGATFGVIGYLKPHAAYLYHKLGHEVAETALKGELGRGKFVSIGDDMTLHTEGVGTDGRLTGIFLEKCDAFGSCGVTTADIGRLVPAPDGTNSVLLMRQGRQIQIPDNDDRPHIQLRVDSSEIAVALPKFRPFRERGGQREEATINELVNTIVTGKPDDLYGDLRAEFHWRILYALSCPLLPLLAAAFGLVDKRGHVALGPIVGLGLLVAYIEILSGGQIAVAHGLNSPWLAMWPVFGAFAALSALCFFVVSERPGGNPLRIAEAVVTSIEAWVKPLVQRVSARVLASWR